MPRLPLSQPQHHRQPSFKVKETKTLRYLMTRGMERKNLVYVKFFLRPSRQNYVICKKMDAARHSHIKQIKSVSERQISVFSYLCFLDFMEILKGCMYVCMYVCITWSKTVQGKNGTKGWKGTVETWGEVNIQSIILAWKFLHGTVQYIVEIHSEIFFFNLLYATSIR